MPNKAQMARNQRFPAIWHKMCAVFCIMFTTSCVKIKFINFLLHFRKFCVVFFSFRTIRPIFINLCSSAPD